MVVDITDLVAKFQSSFVTWSVDVVFGVTIATPWLSWLGWPVISVVYRDILTWIISTLAASAVMQAFFWNTAMRKAGEADDYVDLKNAKEKLPEDVSDADYEKAEQAEMAAFNDLVMLTR